MLSTQWEHEQQNSYPGVVNILAVDNLPSIQAPPVSDTSEDISPEHSLSAGERNTTAKLFSNQLSLEKDEEK